MQTDTYANLVKLIQALIGAGTLTLDEHRNIFQLVNRRLSDAYNTTQSWPRYLVPSEKRDINHYTLSDATSSTSTSVNQNYILLGDNDGNVGKENTNVYQGVTSSSIVIFKSSASQTIGGESIAADSWIVTTGSATKQSDGRYRVVNTTPQFGESDTDKKAALENVEVFTPRAGSDVLGVERKNLIPYAESGENTIGEFFRIHRKKAFLNQSQLEYDFFIDVDGANILNTANSSDRSAFVTYKKQLTLVSITEGGSPAVTDYTNDSTAVPKEFFYYIAHSVYADFLRIERRYEEAIREEASAQNYLAQELEKLDIIANNNNLKKKFSTHLNRNSR